MQDVHESLDRRQTELLVALWRTGHLGRAAATLSISPSAASHRLREAERRLGAELTVAEGRTLRLTPAGVHVAEVADIALTSLRSAEETARWMASAERPTVRLALDFYDTAPWFEQLLGVEDRTSDVDIVRVAYGDTEQSVARRHADLGVVVRPGDVPTPLPDAPIERRLADDELVAVVHRDHAAVDRGRLDPADIEDALYLTAGDRPRHGFEHHEFFEPAGVRPYRLRKVESLTMVLRLIRRYEGVTVQPRLALRNADLGGLATVPLAETRIDVRWHLVTRAEPADGVRDICDVIRRLLDDPR